MCLPHRLIGVSVPKLVFVQDVRHWCPSCGGNATTWNFTVRLLDQVEMSGPVFLFVFSYPSVLFYISHFIFVFVFFVNFSIYVFKLLVINFFFSFFFQIAFCKI